MITTENRLSFAISTIRFPLAVLIVCAHSNPIKFPNLLGDYYCEVSFSNNLIHYLIIFVAWSLFSSAVPCFFAISGYLFFKKLVFFNKRIYFDKLKNRFYTLVLPYVVWNFCFILYFGLWKQLGDIGYLFLWFVGGPYENVVNMRMSCPIDGPLWFVRDLIGAVFLSPIIYYIFKRPKLGLVIFLMLLVWYLFGFSHQYWIPGISVPCLLFYGVGAYLGIHKVNVLDVVSSYRKVVLYIWIALLVIDTLTTHFINEDGLTRLENYVIIHSLTSIFGVVAMLIISARYPSRLLMRLGGSSFVVYALHMPMLQQTYGIILCIFVNSQCMNEFQLLGIYLLVVSILVMFAMVLTEIFDRIKFLRILFKGGR